MSFILKFFDVIMPDKSKRVKNFGLQPGGTIIDYGCGPGLYTHALSKAVGGMGKVIAVDLNHHAEREISKKVQKHGLDNVQFVLATGYDSKIDNKSADAIVALDMFFMVGDTKAFLSELHRICKDDGMLIIDDGHQSRSVSRKNIAESGKWEIVFERKDFMKCKKLG